MARLTKERVAAELQSTARRFKLYSRTAREAADTAPPRSRLRKDWQVRSEVWHGAALEVEQALAVLKAV